MVKISFLVLSLFAAPSLAASLSQAQLPQTGSMVVLPSERAHVIGPTLKPAEIDRATVVWFVTDVETVMDAVDRLEEEEKLAAIEVERIRLAAADAARLEEPVDVERGKVLFAFKAKQIRRIATLNEVLDTLTKYSDALVEVIGHTDAVGSDEENLKLGLARAAHVAAWLQQHGVAQNRVTVASKGESEPEESNDTSAGRKSNRRAMVIVRVKRGQLSTETVDNPVGGKAQIEHTSHQISSAQKRGGNE